MWWGTTHALDADRADALCVQMCFNLSAVQGWHFAALVLALRIATGPGKPSLPRWPH
jgi:hypothetical protein